MTVTPPEYWPPISHIAQMLKSDALEIQLGGTYQKQSFLNRCKIAGVQGVLTLSIPLVGGREQKTPLSDILIDNSQRWAIQHLRTIRSCYGKAPFFDYYFPILEMLLGQPHELLVTLNQKVLNQIISWLKWNGEMITTTDFTVAKKESILSFPAYVQVFADRQPFHANLSILDLLFCLGPASATYLRQMELRNGC